MTKDYIKRQFSNFYEQVVKSRMNTDYIKIAKATKLFDISHIEIPNPYKYSVYLTNGVLSVYAPPEGSVWGNYKILDSDLSDNNGRATIKINVAGINGTYKLALHYKRKSNGNTRIYEIHTFSEVGEYEYTLDLQHLTVYEDYDGNGVYVIIFNYGVNNESYTDHTYFINVDKFDTIVGEDSNLEGDNLTECLSIISAQMDNAVSQLDGSVELATPNGTSYVLQIKNDGTLQTVPKLPNKVLYIGNSLLLGFTNRGMAATTVDKDYYAIVNSYLSAKVQNYTPQKMSGTGFESCTTDTRVTDWFTSDLAPKMSNDIQLVIIQLGDNVNTAEKVAEFEKSCGMMASYVRENCPNARVCWVGSWLSDTKENIYKSACAKYGLTYIPIHDLQLIEGNMSSIGTTYIDYEGNEQTITTEGVAMHPSDKGFEAIAERMIKTLFE